MGIAVPSAAIALMLAISWYGTDENWLFSSNQAEYLDLKQAGRWIKTHSDGSRHIVCHNVVITYYSKAINDGLPYAPLTQTLRYLQARQPDFIVLDSRDETSFPEVKEWIDHGIPDNHAQLVYDTGVKTGNRIEIYRWRHAGRRNS